MKDLEMKRVTTKEHYFIKKETKFDEEKYRLKLQKENIQTFLNDMKRIDREQGIILEKKGWKFKENAKRRVMFTIGDIPLSRRCYEKNGVRRYPLDEYLGLKPYSRYSEELYFIMATTVLDLSCRAAASYFQNMFHLDISKDAIHKARKWATQLYKEREEYRFYEEGSTITKREVKTLYLEGDGLLISTPDLPNGIKKTDFSHFLVHEGIEEEYAHRGKAVQKHEIWTESNLKSREQVVDYLYNHYKFTENTLLITNSDMGHGYTPKIFEEIAETFSCKHIHFWDRAHLNKEITEMMTPFPEEYKEKLFYAIARHDKKKARKVLKAAKKMIPIEEGKFYKKFVKFSSKLQRNFEYTKTPEMRGISSVGIGIMESNHTKLSYRMKKQARHWSVEGALTVGKMIIDRAEGKLRDLFFGNWRQIYQKYKSLDDLRVSQFLKPVHVQQGIRQVRQANKYGSRRY